MNGSKRHFLKTFAAAAVAAGAMPALKASAMPTNPPKRWDAEYDVVICGAGAGGLSAACEAGDRRFSAVVLEKEPMYGGSSAICGGALAFAGTDMQKARGIKDSNELFLSDLENVGQHKNDPALLKVYLDHQLAYYEWLKQHGVKFLDVTNAAGMTVPRAHDTHPEQVVRILRNYAVSKGAKLMLETPVKRLIFDEDSERVTGVVAERDGKQFEIRARKGVLLSCGGYSRNKKLLSQYTPSMVNAKIINGLGNYGDGILMAEEYGADFLDTPYVKATFGFTLHPVSIAKDFALCYYAGAIVTNKEGKRIIDESKSYKLVGDAVLAQTGAIGYQVYDEAIRQRAHKSTSSLLEVEKQPGAIFSGKTIEEAARKAGVDPAALAETVRQYNGYVAAGNDAAFGRKHLSGGYGKPVPIKKPPFYVFPSTAVIIGTYAGVRVTPKLEVVDVFGEKIPGLYATGEMIGGFHGAAYMTGTAFGKTQVLGRVAIGSMAEA